MGWTADYPDPDTFLRVALQRVTGEIWQHSEYNDLVDRAKRSIDNSERLLLYQKAQQLLIDEVPVLPLQYIRNDVLLKPWITEYPLSPLRWDYFKDVVIEPHD